jgi:hypothetical protein
MFGERSPAQAGLRLNVGGTGFPLGIQGVEVLFQPLLRRLAGVNPTSERSWCAHIPKNLGPDQWVPVIALAMVDSERCRFPSQRKPPSTASTWWVRPFHSRMSLVPGLMLLLLVRCVEVRLIEPEPATARAFLISAFRPPNACSWMS